MGRPPCCDKSNVKRGLWTSEEDAKILAYVAKHGIGNWSMVPKKAGLNRCGKSCRLRWTNYLRPDLKRNDFTPEEEQLIIDYHKAIGSRWSLIAQNLPGRTDNDVKNYWNTKLKKKLQKMGIDPITHKPYSQILTDFGKINSTLPNHTLAFPSEPQNFEDNKSFLNIMNQENNSNFQPNFYSGFSHGDSVLEQKRESGFENKEAVCSSSSEKTFVEEMLDKDSEMQMEFPEFMSEYFNY